MESTFDCVVIGDLHFREELVANLFELAWFLINNAPEEIEELVLLGDVLHSKTVISYELLTAVARFFNLLSERFKVIRVIEGNHDQDKFSRESHLSFLRLNPRIKLYSEPTIEEGIGFFPYSINVESNKAAFDSFAENADLCFVHQDLFGFLNNEFHKSEIGVETEEYEGSDCLFLCGHYHTPQRSRNFLVLGSVIQDRIDEAGQVKYYGIISNQKLKIKVLPASIWERFVYIQSAEDFEKARGKCAVIESELHKSLTSEKRQELDLITKGVRVKQQKQLIESEANEVTPRVVEGVEYLFKKFIANRNEYALDLGPVLMEEVCE